MTSVIVGVNEKMLNLMPRRNGRFTFLMIDSHISFYSLYTIILPTKPNSFFPHLKRGIQDFYTKYVLVLEDKLANNVVVV